MVYQPLTSHFYITPGPWSFNLSFPAHSLKRYCSAAQPSVTRFRRADSLWLEFRHNTQHRQQISEPRFIILHLLEAAKNCAAQHKARHHWFEVSNSDIRQKSGDRAVRAVVGDASRWLDYTTPSTATTSTYPVTHRSTMQAWSIAQ